MVKWICDYTPEDRGRLHATRTPTVALPVLSHEQKRGAGLQNRWKSHRGPVQRAGHCHCLLGDSPWWLECITWQAKMEIGQEQKTKWGAATILLLRLLKLFVGPHNGPQAFLEWKQSHNRCYGNASMVRQLLSKKFGVMWHCDDSITTITIRMNQQNKQIYCKITEDER